MSRTAITVENLSKAYHIGLKESRADTLVGALQGIVRAPMKNFRRLARMNTFRHCDESEDIFWALKDVSFEVAEGEVVGIIGRNGAGKSTLLKILSRITEPTKGRAIIRGRVSSLLEVGTGFHPELSGRDNVYMNGTILGMTKREIDRKFDKIVDFSGVEKFLDTPIKHYSSGMKVRLAFSVAAHLEPEILIIDEVLAVGDAEFQKKCLGKMQDVAREGRTVLFVSHNMNAVANLTTRCVVLTDGGIKIDSDPTIAIEEYLKSGFTDDIRDVDLMPRREQHLGRVARITDVRPIYENGFGYEPQSPLVLQVRVRATRCLFNARFGVTISDSAGSPLLTTTSPANMSIESSLEQEFELILEDTRLAPGRYVLSMSIGQGGLNEPRLEYDVVRDAISFEISSVSNEGRAPVSWSSAFGAFQLPSSHCCVNALHVTKEASAKC